MVEQLAHNELDIGSNPIKLKIMIFLIKNYKTIKIKNLIKENKLIFLFYNDINSVDWIIFKPQLKFKNINFFSNSKKIINKLLHNSIYVSFKALNSQAFISGYIKKYFLVFKNDLKLMPLKILAIKLNKQFYYSIQIKTNFSFHYVINKLCLFKFMIVNLKTKSK